MNHKLQIRKSKNKGGYTLIETMIAVAIFIIIVTDWHGCIIKC